MMPNTMMRYTEPNFERADLALKPRYMGWGEWKLVLDALQMFVTAWDSVDMDFSVLTSVDTRPIGIGFLARL